jgi:hypothetical protein
MVAPGVAGARRPVVARTIALARIVIAAKTRTVSCVACVTPVIARPAAERPLTTRTVVMPEIAARRMIAVALEVATWRPLAVLAKRPALLAAPLVPAAHIALRTVIAVEVAAWRAVAIAIEVTARPIAAFPEIVARPVGRGTPIRTPATAALVSRPKLPPILAVEIAARAAIAVFPETALPLAAEALAVPPVAETLSVAALGAASATRGAIALLAKRARAPFAGPEAFITFAKATAATLVPSAPALGA